MPVVARRFTILYDVVCLRAGTGFTVLPMNRETETRPGALLVRQRWDRPENVARRVNRLAAEIAKLPALTREQRTALTEAIKATPR